MVDGVCYPGDEDQPNGDVKDFGLSRLVGGPFDGRWVDDDATAVNIALRVPSTRPPLHAWYTGQPDGSFQYQYTGRISSDFGPPILVLEADMPTIVTEDNQHG